MPSRFDSTRPQYNRFSGSSSAPESDGTTIPEPQMTMANWETPVLRGSGFSSGYENDEASLISGGTPKAPLIFSTAVVRRSEMLPPSTPQNYSIGPNTTTQKRKRPRITGAASKPAQSAEGGPSDKTATATIAKSRVQDKSTANTTPVMSKYFSTSKQTDQQKEIHEKGTGELGTATSSKRHLTPWPEEPPEADTTPVAKKVAKRTGTTVGTRVRKPAVPRKK